MNITIKAVINGRRLFFGAVVDTVNPSPIGKDAILPLG